MCVCGDGRWLFVQAKHLRNWCQDRFLWVCLTKSCNHAYSIFLHHITPNDFAPHGVAGFSTSSSSNTRGSENSGVGLVFARLLQKWKRHEILMNFDESWQSQLNCQNWVAWRWIHSQTTLLPVRRFGLNLICQPEADSMAKRTCTWLIEKNILFSCTFVVCVLRISRFCWVPHCHVSSLRLVQNRAVLFTTPS